MGRSRPEKMSIPSARPAPAMPDRRLASLFTKRGTTAPATAGSVGMLAPYAPTANGLAQFSASLRESLLGDRPGVTVEIVRMNPGGALSEAREVVHELAPDGLGDHRAAATALNRFDIVVIQHLPGPETGGGEQVLKVLDWINVPVVAVLHSVPAAASLSPQERQALVRLTDSADAVVTLSEDDRQRLFLDYEVAPRKVMLIRHGAWLGPTAPPPVHRRRPVVLTWGFLASGKGIEWGIDAMHMLRDLDPSPLYVVAGPTLERYGQWLARRAQLLNVSHMVDFRPGPIGKDELAGLVAGADAVLLPFDAAEPISSGALVEALAAGIPVVTTPFTHAQELMVGAHNGRFVGHRDAGAIAGALQKILARPDQPSPGDSELRAMLRWPAVAAQYRQLFDALLRRPTVSPR